MSPSPSTAESSSGPFLVIRYLLVGVRLYLGAWMLLNGLNHFLPIFPQPMGGGIQSSQLMVTLIETGLFGLVKVTEIFIGSFLLLDLFVPVALVMSLPISVVIWYNAILGGRTFTVSMASGCLVWTLVLMLAYLRYFLPMMRAQSLMGTLTDVRGVGSLISPDMHPDTPESRHRIVICILGILLTSALAYHLHPSAALEAGSGKTPLEIVNAYQELAYHQGKRSEAERLYVAQELTAGADGVVDGSASDTGGSHVLVTIAQGTLVAVYSQEEQSRSRAVDIYRVAHNRIVEHTRVSSDVAISGR